MNNVSANKIATTKEAGDQTDKRDSVRAWAVHPNRRNVINLARSNYRNVPVCQKQTAACL